MSETKANYQGAQIVHIPLSDIAPSALNPRKHFSLDGMIELADDIRLNGVLQPITIRERTPQTPVGSAGLLDYLTPPLASRPYQIVMGERRWRASCRVEDMVTIPCIIRYDLDDAAHLRLAYSENAKRADLTPIECATAYQRMLELEPTLTQEGLGARLGVSQARIANRLRLLKLPETIRTAIDNRQISESVALELCRLSDHPNALVSLYLSALGEQWTQAKTFEEVSLRKSQIEAQERQSAARASLDIEPEPEPADVEEPATLQGKPRMDYSAPNKSEEQEPVNDAEVMPETAQPATSGPDAITRPIEPIGEKEIIAISQSDVDVAAGLNACQKLGEGKGVPAVYFYWHEDEPYLIYGSVSGGSAIGYRYAEGHHMILRSEYTGEIRTYQECVRRLPWNQNIPPAFLGMLVTHKGRENRGKEYVTSGRTVRFAVAEVNETAPMEPTPRIDPLAALVEEPGPQPPPILAKLEEMRQEGAFIPGAEKVAFEIPAPPTLPSDIEEWLFEQALTPEQAIRQLMRMKPYAISPLSRKIVDKAMKLLPEDHPCKTPGEFIDGAVGIHAARLGVEVGEL